MNKYEVDGIGMNNFYHYTPAYRAAMILRSGFLMPSTIGLIKSDTPYIWFSSNQKKENTATIGSKTISLLLGKHMVRHMRFSYNGSDLTPYRNIKLRSTHRKMLERKANGSFPINWYGIEGCLPINKLTLEDHVNGIWEPINNNTLLNEFEGIHLELLDGKVGIQIDEKFQRDAARNEPTAETSA